MGESSDGDAVAGFSLLLGVFGSRVGVAIEGSRAEAVSWLLICCGSAVGLH